MSRIEKSVFISYRRTNLPWALNVYQDLTHHGYDVFFDFEGIGSGDFESIIVDNITSRAHFVLILTPSALERCNEPGDWLRREIEIAIESKRNIVPLMMESFSFGSPQIAAQLTGKLAPLRSYNGLGLSAEYFLACMEKLHNKFLNVTLAAVPQPASRIAQQAATEQRALANAAPPVQEQELTAQQFFERGVASSNPEEQILLYTRAIQLKPDFADAYNNRAVARQAKGDLHGALLDFEEAIRLKPEHPDIYYNRANALRAKGDIDGALMDYNKSVQLQPDDASAYNNRALGRRDKGDLDGALLDYNEAIRLKPDLVNAHVNRANTYQDRGDMNAAIIGYNEAIRLEPNYAYAYYNRGRALQTMRQYPAAITDYECYLNLGGGERDGDAAQVENIIRSLREKL